MLDEEPSRSKEDIHIDSNYCYSLEGTKEGKAKKASQDFEQTISNATGFRVGRNNRTEKLLGSHG